MATYAFLDHVNLVVDMIEGEDELINGVNAAEWYQNHRGMTCVKVEEYAGIGMGYNNGIFLPKPHEGAIWDGEKWLPSIDARVTELEDQLKKVMAHLNITS